MYASFGVFSNEVVAFYLIFPFLPLCMLHLHISQPLFSLPFFFRFSTVDTIDSGKSKNPKDAKKTVVINTQAVATSTLCPAKCARGVGRTTALRHMQIGALGQYGGQ